MNKKNSIIVLSILLIGIAALVLLRDTFNKEEVLKPIPLSIPTPEPRTTPTPTPTPIPKQTTQVLATPEPRPTAPPLNESDSHIQSRLGKVPKGTELLAFLTDEEIVRKVVRAVYGLSEGRIVKEYRPINSPKKRFSTIKIGQQTEGTQQELYRISQENYARYEKHIELLATVNSPQMITLYQFYRPTLEAAYQELGVRQENFHRSLIKAITLLLNTPESQDDLLLVRPSVMYKYSDPALEKLPSAHKLMLRMGEKNRAALKLELRVLKERLEQLKPELN